ncbi:MAG: prolipoprotein diacylglyceryl transferase [Acidobacteria bacterium]|nr:prolipoprotein diacylglyceryl transferase [Acidobacteriota bacterium]
MFPKLVDIGPLTLHTYGLMLAVAYLAAITLTARLASREGVPRNQIWDLGFVVIISAIFGSKLLMLVADWEEYSRRPSLLLSMEFWQAAGVFYGGLLGAVLASALYLWKKPGLPFWKVADAAAPAIALGQSIGRLGCFSAGCCYGRPADLPWSLVFSSQYAHDSVGVPLGIPLHPTQLYESVLALMIFVLLLFLYPRKQFPGQIFITYLICYSIIRFILEFFRGDPDRGFVLGGLLSTSQLISLILVPIAMGGYIFAQRKGSGAVRTRGQGPHPRS